MTWLAEIIQQALRNVWGHKVRSGLTMFGTSWGIASIIFMLAIGDGLKLGYRNMLYEMGKDIAIVWGGRTAGQAGGQRAGREVRLTLGDARAIQRECYLVGDVTPELSRTLPAASPHNAGLFSTHGVAPVYQEIRSMTLAAGRFFNARDLGEERRVCLLGPLVKKQLFADRPAAGARMRIGDVPFLVVGELAEKDQQNSYNGMDAEKIIIPYTTMAAWFPDPRPSVGREAVDNLIFTPVSADLHEEAVRQVRRLLGRRHQFQPGDEGAVWIWDTVRSARVVNRVYDALQTFLAVVALITLGLGGIGVMNIMLVAVAERTREIGLKQAVGASPARILAEFFLEGLFLTLLSGAAGVAFAWGVSSIVSRLPLPTMFAGLPISQATVALAVGTLVTVGILAGIYPAGRAARLTPVEALRYE